MRFVLYNMRYATGPKMHHYMRPSGKNLKRIAGWLSELEPDLVGLIEVDHGSYRSNGKNQVEVLAEELGHYHSHAIKYGERSLWRRLPVVGRQGNAFLCRDRIRNETFHYFDKGMKRLVIELELEHLDVYLVHLALGGKARHRQLGALYELIKNADRPVMIAGDFNTLWGEREIDLFLAATGLKNANLEGLPTFPSHRPQRHLDFILHSPEIHVCDFQVPQVTYSDHLPIVVDLAVEVPAEMRSEDRPAHCYCPPEDPFAETIAGFQDLVDGREKNHAES